MYIYITPLFPINKTQLSVTPGKVYYRLKFTEITYTNLIFKNVTENKNSSKFFIADLLVLMKCS